VSHIVQKCCADDVVGRTRQLRKLGALGSVLELGDRLTDVGAATLVRVPTQYFSGRAFA
jgi:hypothetical protein